MVNVLEKVQRMSDMDMDNGLERPIVRLSRVGKMPCKSFSLPARTTCPGSIVKGEGKVEVCGVCRKCYATKGNYRFPKVKAVREENLEATKHPSFVADMVAKLEGELIKEKMNTGADFIYFRWFDSGDIYSPEFAEKVFKICVQTPFVRHWIPTKSYDVDGIREWIQKLEILPNVCVRKSGKELDKLPEVDGCTSTVHTKNPIGFNCPAIGSRCGNCRACWNKKIKNISYSLH